MIAQYGARSQAELAAPVSWQEVCIPCRRAFHDRRSWEGHSARKHGYRSHAFLCAEDSTCRSCGKRFSTVGRLRRHLVSRPACVTSWGSFVPAGAGLEAMHAQALPELVAGHLPDRTAERIRTDVAQGLLSELLLAEPSDEQAVWSLVQGYVEPLGVLRNTLAVWRDGDPACPLRAQTADNILLLLDVDLLADSYQPISAARNPLLAQAPDWPLPRGASLVCGRPCQALALEPPPKCILDPFAPRSMRVRDAAAYSSWLEAACTVCARLLEVSRTRPCGIFCHGLELALGPAADWMRAAGFNVWADGVASPA